MGWLTLHSYSGQRMEILNMDSLNCKGESQTSQRVEILGNNSSISLSQSLIKPIPCANKVIRHLMKISTWFRIWMASVLDSQTYWTLKNVSSHLYLEKYLLTLAALNPQCPVWEHVFFGFFFPKKFLNRKKIQLGCSSIKTQPDYGRTHALDSTDIFNNRDFAKMKDSTQGPLSHGSGLGTKAIMMKLSSPLFSINCFGENSAVCNHSYIFPSGTKSERKKTPNPSILIIKSFFLMFLFPQQELEPKLIYFLLAWKLLVVITTLHQIPATDLDGKTP